MSWNTTSPLSSAAITAARLEQSTLDLWKEFLEGYFSGASHAIDGVGTDLPLVALSFQASKLPSQPLSGTAISIVWVKQGKISRHLIRGKVVGFLVATFTFYVRSSGQNTGNGGPKVQAKRVCDLLFALLSSKSNTLPLSRKGIHQIRPSQPTLITSGEWVERVMSVRARLTFDIT